MDGLLLKLLEDHTGEPGRWFWKLFEPIRQDLDRMFWCFLNQPWGAAPASELRPGAVQVRVEGIEGIVWLLPEDVQLGELKHPPFEDDLREAVRRMHAAFAEQRALSFEEWEDGFRRDTTPEPEIAIWLHVAEVYTEFAGAESSAERRRDIYR